MQLGPARGHPRAARIAGIVVGAIGVYLLVWFVAALAFAQFGQPGFDPAVGLVVPLAVVYGPVGVAAAAGAVVVRDLLVGGLGAPTLVGSFAHLVMGAVAFRLWSRGLHRRPGTDRVGSLRGTLVFVGVALVACSAGAAVVGWGNELLAIAPFFLAVVTAGEYLLATVVIGAPALALFDRIRGDVGSHVASRFDAGIVPVGVLSAGWLLVGTVGSLGFRNAARLPPHLFEQHGLGAVRPLADEALFGPGGVRAQAVFGALVLVALAVVLRPEDGRESASTGEGSG